MARKQKKKSTVRPEPRRGKVGESVPGWVTAVEQRGTWVALLGIALLLVLFFNPVFFAGNLRVASRVPYSRQKGDWLRIRRKPAASDLDARGGFGACPRPGAQYG